MGIRPRLPLPEHLRTELDRRDWVLEQLSQWFDFELEVPGTHCSGQRLRLDAVLMPRDSSGWKDDRPAFGVEFKLPSPGRTSDFTAWAAQSVDYTHTNWQGYGRLKVFMCPSPFVGLHQSEWPRLVVRMLGQLGVGDLCQIPYRGWALFLHDEILWDQSKGPVKSKYWSIRPRAGHR